MKTFQELKRNTKKNNSGFPVLKVALLDDTAIQFLALAIRSMGYERDYHLNLFEAEYNQMERQVLESTSDLYRFSADYTLVFQPTHKLLEKYSLLFVSEQAYLAKERLDFNRYR